MLRPKFIFSPRSDKIVKVKNWFDNCDNVLVVPIDQNRNKETCNNKNSSVESPEIELSEMETVEQGLEEKKDKIVEKLIPLMDKVKKLSKNDAAAKEDLDNLLMALEDTHKVLENSKTRHLPRRATRKTPEAKKQSENKSSRASNRSNKSQDRNPTISKVPPQTSLGCHRKKRGEIEVLQEASIHPKPQLAKESMIRRSQFILSGHMLRNRKAKPLQLKHLVPRFAAKVQATPLMLPLLNHKPIVDDTTKAAKTRSTKTKKKKDVDDTSQDVDQQPPTRAALRKRGLYLPQPEPVEKPEVRKKVVEDPIRCKPSPLCKKQKSFISKRPEVQLSPTDGATENTSVVAAISSDGGQNERRYLVVELRRIDWMPQKTTEEPPYTYFHQLVPVKKAKKD